MYWTLGKLLALPALLTLSIPITSGQSQDWPYNLPAGAKYYPEHESYLKRDLEIQRRINTAPPSAMRKMSEDEGEKFFLDYWQFDIPDYYHGPSIRRSANPGP